MKNSLILLKFVGFAIIFRIHTHTHMVTVWLHSAGLLLIIVQTVFWSGCAIHMCLKQYWRKHLFINVFMHRTRHTYDTHISTMHYFSQRSICVRFFPFLNWTNEDDDDERFIWIMYVVRIECFFFEYIAYYTDKVFKHYIVKNAPHSHTTHIAVLLYTWSLAWEHSFYKFRSLWISRYSVDWKHKYNICYK